MTPSPETPQNPFSTVLALRIMDLIHARDIELGKLREDYRLGTVTKDQIETVLTASEAKIADDILEACSNTMRNLEGTVNQVLQLQEQMKILRNAGALPS